MKTKCQTLKLSIMLSIISFTIFSVFFFFYKFQNYVWCEYIYNIFLGLFGSSSVVFLIAIGEYKVAKTQLLEKIWNESRILIEQLYKIKPIYSDVNNNLLVAYINEWLLNQTQENKILLGNKHDSYDKFYNYLYKQHKNLIKKLPQSEVKSYVDSLIKHKREQILENLEKAIEQYLNLNNYNFNEFNNLLGDVQFFFNHETEYLKLCRNIYDPLMDIYDELKINVCRHFKLYRNGEIDRLDVLLSILFENQSKLFKFELMNEEEHEWCNVYAYFCDDIMDKIEEFRAKTIYNCKPKPYVHYPVQSFYHSKKL